MKTIFISAFEGVEAKNILRTDILPTLLGNTDIRLVLLMKNQERVELYKKEFNDPRIIYEIVPYSRALGRGLDRFFATLKFSLLRTKTTNLQRRLAFETTGSYLTYYFGHIINFLLAGPSVRRAARFFDFLLVRSNIYAQVFEIYNPDLVFLAHLYEEPEIHILREAKRRNIKSIGFMNSWDKITARCILRLLPDKAVVFNNIVRGEMVKYNEMREEDIFVGGIPQYDIYFRQRNPVSGKKRLIMFGPMGPALSDSDFDFIDLLRKLNAAGKFGENIEILVRFQPNDSLDESELKKRPDLQYDLPGRRFAVGRGVDWDMSSADMNRLAETLHEMSLLICYASSLSIDAAIFDKPVININFEIRNDQVPFKIPTRRYATAHYQNVINAGAVSLVNSEDELVGQVKKYLQNPSLDKEGRRRLVSEQCGFLDGNSGKRIGEFILSYCGR